MQKAPTMQLSLGLGKKAREIASQSILLNWWSEGSADLSDQPRAYASVL